MADAQISLEEAEQFEAACKEYAQHIESAVAFLRTSIERVGETWKDADYETVCGMVADIEREAMAAHSVTNDSIIPFVSKKVEVLKSK